VHVARSAGICAQNLPPRLLDHLRLRRIVPDDSKWLRLVTCCNQKSRGIASEDPMLNDSRNAIQRCGGCRKIRNDVLEIEVDDEVAVICYGWILSVLRARINGASAEHSATPCQLGQ